MSTAPAPTNFRADLSMRSLNIRDKGDCRVKVALITGGDSGIGRAVASAYAREAADIAISYLAAEAEDVADREH